MIKYLKHNEIDKVKWDNSIANANNVMVYAFSWYLDIISPNWEALIYNNYDAVMPLTQKRKYFISYLFQPFFTQQLGVFSKEESQAILVQDFIKAIPKKFKLIDINLNEDNSTDGLTQEKNYLLSLSESYENIYSAYKTQAKRNIKKAKEQNLYVQAMPHKQVVDFYMKYKEKETKGVKHSDYLTLKKLYKSCNKQNYLISNGVYSKEKGLLACAAFIIYNNRIIFHLGTTNMDGKNWGAMHFLIDTLIVQFAERNMFIDFEGSKIEGIERFYKSFGAYKKPYFKYKNNNLPPFISWLK